MHLKSLAIIVFLFASGILHSQDEVDMVDYVYVTNIKSVTFSPLGNTLEPAVTYLGNGVALELSFDDMDADQKDFTYDIIHCDRDWQPSEILKQEYIDGFVNEEIDDWRFSTGTFVTYTNYRMRIPNRDVRLTISGNYVLVVYDGEEDEDRIPVLTRRFVVVDRKVDVIAKSRRPMDVFKIDTHQDFDISINHEDFSIIDPMVNLTIDVVQNGNWNASITNIVPRTVLGDKIIVDNTNKISFPGVNEFRSADLRSFDIVSNDVHALELTEDGTDVLLKLASSRKDLAYSSYPDANGAFIIATRDGNSDRTQSDYGNVIFPLDFPEQEKEIYVLGKFTDWIDDDMYMMTYDYNREIYVAEILLKQGFYDYMYAIKEDDGTLNPVPIEGSTFEADNDYFVYVYLREPGDRYDRVIGFAKVVPSFF